MEGDSGPSFDNRGLHVYSYLWGRIHALSGLVPYLRELEPEPHQMQKEARADAADLYREKVLSDANERKV
jgi:hypothetical protein